MTVGRRRKMGISILIPFAIVALVFGVQLWKKVHDSRDVTPDPQPHRSAQLSRAVLFFVAADGVSLAREARELEPCDTEQACMKSVIDELVGGPVGELDEALPEAAAVNSVERAGDVAVVDMNRPFAADLPAGSAAEMLAVYSIVNTICVNFPEITRVRLTVEGDPRSRLRHLDLSEPLGPDFTLETATPAQGGHVVGAPAGGDGGKP